ncbi:MAG: hypothetical protein EPO16_09550 [Dehalococcoidia bacterium]|nr:MAG: hypothetical protein EPO16_09550 [Dehalococcoidia bacterium]
MHRDRVTGPQAKPYEGLNRLDRRRFLALAGGGAAAAFLAACSRDSQPLPTSASAAEGAPDTTLSSMPAPAPTPEPVFAAGTEPFLLMPGTLWETSGVAIHSGLPGPRVMVFGGVHGNEPGGWLAAEEIARWRPLAGSLIVMPRLNRLSTVAFVRTVDGFGDLNRSYPGDPNSPLPMSRMAAEVVKAANYYRPRWIFDLHESWMFYNERGASGGTAFIGQTIATGGTAETLPLIRKTMDIVNERISLREQFTLRTSISGQPGASPPSGLPSATPAATAAPGSITPQLARGSSSLGFARWVDGCTPVLIEMGQYNQDEGRRAELHTMLVRTAMERLGML